MTDSLHRYFLNNSDLRLHKWIHYFDVYERHFRRFRGKNPVVLEIGVFGGGSLAMWRDYFGAGCQILGLDINPVCKKYETEGSEIFIGDQSDPLTLNAILESYPNIDIVIDDGSHLMKDMRASFEFLYPKISKNGCYLVEDTHTCYWSEYGGGLGKQNSFIEFAKGLIDHLNACHTRGDLAVSEISRSTDSINFYDSIVAFEKRPQGVRQALITSGM
jgi:hypothetical protein